MRGSNVEDSLFEIFGRFMRGADQGVVSASFHATLNFGIKLAATDAAARMSIGQDPEDAVFKEWQTFRTRLQRRSDARNNIVHYHFYAQEENRNVERRYFLAPTYYDTRTDWGFGSSQHPRKMFLKELGEAAASFEALDKDLLTFIEKLVPHPKRRASYRALWVRWTQSDTR